MIKLVMLTLLMGLSGNTAFADNAKKDMPMKMPAMTADQRSKMADAHDKMAACLRTAKPLSDCHDEMMKTCKDVMGKECPMMHGKGMHHDKMEAED